MSVHEVEHHRLSTDGRVSAQSVPKPPRIRCLRVDSRRNSTCGSARLDDLDWNDWWTDHSFGSFYLHVRHKVMQDTSHRVYCRHTDAPRLACNNGVLYWLVSEEAKETQ